jgi:hypothetical protein
MVSQTPIAEIQSPVSNTVTKTLTRFHLASQLAVSRSLSRSESSQDQGVPCKLKFECERIPAF